MSALALFLAVAIQTEPRTVARIELEAPDRSPCLVRATIPLPSGFVLDPKRSPFAIRFPGKDGATVPAQCEIVARGPTGEAEVVELLAVGSFAPQVRAGARVSCGVVLREPAERAESPATPESVSALLAPEKRSMFLLAHDVFGNGYMAELRDGGGAWGFTAATTTKSGPWLRERKLAAVLEALRPADHGDGSTGPALPHLMGVHAYIREIAGESSVGLDLRVHNGLISTSDAQHPPESPLGIVYWKSLELFVPKEWNVVSDVGDPFLGEAYENSAWRVLPIVKPYENGALHMMGPQCQFERRLTLVRNGSEAHGKALARFQGLAFCVPGKDLWSWWNPSTARYFPQRELLATVDYYRRGEHGGRTKLDDRLLRGEGELARTIASGSKCGWYVETGALGWAHPWFVKEQGGVGGEGIALVEGHDVAGAASRAGYHQLALLHRMNVSRQPEATYDSRGEIVGYRAWLDAEGRIPFDYRTHGNVRLAPFLLPMNGGPVASAHVRAVVERGLRPPYDLGTPYEHDGSLPDANEALLAWWPHDDQHLIRYTKNTKALVWLGNDSMAKDDLRLSAELFHLMFHESPHIPAEWSPGLTLRFWEGVAQEHPRQGLPLGREHAWGIDAMCAAYALASPEWRERERPWFVRVAKLLVAGAMPNGLIQRSLNERFFDEPYKYLGTQTFEHLFLVHAMRCLSAGVLRGVDDETRATLEALTLRGLETLFFGPPFQRIPSDWQPDPAQPTIFFRGPRQTIAVSLNDERATPPFSDEQRWGKDYAPKDGFGGGVEIVHIWGALLAGERIGRESDGLGLSNRWLQRTLACGESKASFSDLVRSFAEQASDPSSDDSGNWIGLAGRLQALGVR